MAALLAAATVRGWLPKDLCRSCVASGPAKCDPRRTVHTLPDYLLSRDCLTPVMAEYRDHAASGRRVHRQRNEGAVNMKHIYEAPRILVFDLTSVISSLRSAADERRLSRANCSTMGESLRPGSSSACVDN